MPFRISNSLWSLAESCWAKTPQSRPSAIAICDAICSILASHSDASLITNVALPSTAASSVVLRGAPPRYESGPLASSPIYSPTTPVGNTFPVSQLPKNQPFHSVDSAKFPRRRCQHIFQKRSLIGLEHPVCCQRLLCCQHCEYCSRSQRLFDNDHPHLATNTYWASPPDNSSSPPYFCL